jgi:hypothetical protein
MIMSKVYYKEEQKFNQWWIWLLIAVCCGIWVWQFVQQIIMGKPFGNNPMSDLGVILTGIFPILVLLLFRLLKLETLIDEEGIKCRFMPFQRKYKTFLPRDIAKYEVKKYNPLMEYGGWGIRYGRKGTAYNVRGNMGLYLELKNKKNFLIGTQTPDSIRYAVEKLMKMNER